MRRWAGVLALVGLAFGVGVFGLGQGLAQTSSGIPDGTFVRDSAGNVWLVAGGQRSHVPLYPTTDELLVAVPASDKWVVPHGDGSGTLTLGPAPSWAAAQPTGATANGVLAVAAPATANALPTVTIQVDDENISPGQAISVTLIAADDGGVEWIEWEGTHFDGGDDNDNRSTGDPHLDGRHRYQCDGQRQCANVWKIAPTKSGRWTLRARARDSSDQRSAWVSIQLRVR